MSPQIEDVAKTMASIRRKGSVSSDMDTHNAYTGFPASNEGSNCSSPGYGVAHYDSIKAATGVKAKFYTDHRSLPTLEAAFSQFKQMFPRYTETLRMDTLRAQEYFHLEETGRVCLDYCGFGLFSYLQHGEDWESASFGLSSISVNLYSHALFGAAQHGTLECAIRRRIMEYLNIQESEYHMVFTASRGAAFKLVADAYPFDTCKRLITMYDYESESVNWLAQRAKEKGAKISDVSFKWPSLRIMSRQLQKVLVGKRRRKGSAKGLFVFPAQSRVSGAKYSYQWMSLAQQNKWHVLLDASALGPKDMDSLGLSLFKPDFIIASFYKIFGADPSGFACLFIKDTAMKSVRDQCGDVAPGIVRIVPYPFQWSSSEASESNNKGSERVADVGDEEDDASTDFEFPLSSQLVPAVASFSGPMLGFEKFYSQDDKSAATKDDDDDSCVCDSTGEVSRSPVFSEEGTENLFSLDGSGFGLSPVGSTGHGSIGDEQFSGHLRGSFCGSIHNPVYDGQMKFPGRESLQNPLFEQHSAVEEAQIRELPKIASNEATTAIKQRSENGSLAMYNNHVGELKQNRHSESEIEEVKDAEEEKLQLNNNESAIRRETEGDFRLLGRRDGYRHTVGRSVSPFSEDSKEISTFDGGRGSFVTTENSVDLYYDDGSSYYDDDEEAQTEEDVDDEQWDGDDNEIRIECKGLDHADILGLNKATVRLRYLVNWLIGALLQLRHASTDKMPLLVHIYGPHVKYDRGASIAFNLYDRHGKLIHPELVQMLADKNNISLSIGFLRNLHMPDIEQDNKKVHRLNKNLNAVGIPSRIEVVTAALSFLSTFQDIYKLWLFTAKFLDVDFVCKELGGHKVSNDSRDNAKT